MKAIMLKQKYRTKEQNWIKPTKSASLPQSTTLCETARKRKNLKEVLQNLHDEFDTLNKYVLVIFCGVLLSRCFQKLRSSFASYR